MGREDLMRAALRDAVRQLCTANSLDEMRSMMNQIYTGIKTGKMLGKNSMIEAFINFSLRRYLSDPLNPPPVLPQAEAYDGELRTIQYRLRQLGVLPPKT